MKERRDTGRYREGGEGERGRVWGERGGGVEREDGKVREVNIN